VLEVIHKNSVRCAATWGLSVSHQGSLGEISTLSVDITRTPDLRLYCVVDEHVCQQQILFVDCLCWFPWFRVWLNRSMPLYLSIRARYSGDAPKRFWLAVAGKVCLSRCFGTSLI
jgi:hypothetical protein